MVKLLKIHINEIMIFMWYTNGALPFTFLFKFKMEHVMTYVCKSFVCSDQVTPWFK